MFFGNGGVADQGSGFAKRVERFRLIWFQGVCAFEFSEGLWRFALLQQRGAQSVGGLCLAGLEFRLGARPGGGELISGFPIPRRPAGTISRIGVASADFPGKAPK
jgi:hypothetical protein